MDFKLSNNKDIMVEFHDENGNRVLGRLIEDFMSNNQTEKAKQKFN